MTIEQLVETLNKGQHTLVLFDSQGQLHTFNNRGVKDLYQLLTQQPEVLKGALVADKVVGKGAAALMAAGGVARLHTHTVSKPAKELLGKAGIDFAFDVEVDHIENRAKNGWCPVETLCKNANTAQECLPLIANFIKQMKQQP